MINIMLHEFHILHKFVNLMVKACVCLRVPVSIKKKKQCGKGVTVGKESGCSFDFSASFKFFK